MSLAYGWVLAISKRLETWKQFLCTKLNRRKIQSAGHPAPSHSSVRWAKVAKTTLIMRFDPPITLNFCLQTVCTENPWSPPKGGWNWKLLALQICCAFWHYLLPSPFDYLIFQCATALRPKYRGLPAPNHHFFLPDSFSLFLSCP